MRPLSDQPGVVPDSLIYVDRRQIEPVIYFFLPDDPRVGCHAPAFWLGAAAIALIFSFLGFLASRLLLCWRLAMSTSLGLSAAVNNVSPGPGPLHLVYSSEAEVNGPTVSVRVASSNSFLKPLGFV